MVLFYSNSNKSNYNNNNAGDDGGVVAAGWSSTANSNNNNYNNNYARRVGGVVEIYYSSILNSTSDHFENNRAGSDGGVVHSNHGNVSVIKVNAISNVAEGDGGVFRLLGRTLNFEIREGNFTSNSAKRGGVISANGFTGDQPTIKLKGSISFSGNNAETGGVLYIQSNSLHADNDNVIMLVNNSAETAIMYIMDSTCHLSGHTTLSHNSAETGVVHLMDSSCEFLAVM